MKCPTCPDAHEDCCCSCDSPLGASDLVLAPNPYADEINGDSRDHLECEECRYQAAMDI